MPHPATDSIVIDKNNSGFPGYLDFNALRTSSIQYLSGLTGKIWTDYNVHDPGITILEALIYALLDLGYRTNLRAKDIFTRNPAITGPDNNFFTPAEILSCNPLTIADFRKMLVDINGVKNAWLQVAEDIKLDTYCIPPGEQDGAGALAANRLDYTNVINGLYHITLQVDDFTLRTREDIITEVKKVLLSHRNLCEDFIDIAVLCGLKIGICADIGLQPGADVEEVCRNILMELESFFSPAPKFYTLHQLLDKGKKIEDIFVGRPYDLEHSNGFVDIVEFEKIEQKKEIHLSDVYNAILSVNGVDTVRKLKLKNEEGNFTDSWQFLLPEGYLPVFSSDMSSMQFSVNGILVPLDFQKISRSPAVLPGNSTKLARQQSDMDLVIPRGVYHNDLANYYSIQNEFPLVYGIGEGGLPATASLQRQAQALQLKGYLLFFDQLLANYLTQLSNIRSLFSFRSPKGIQPQSYFVNPLSNVPDLEKLLLNVSDDNGKSTGGDNGKVLGYPIWKSDLEKLLKQETYSSSDLKKLQQSFTCRTQHEYRVISASLQNSFRNPELYVISSKRSTVDNHSFYTVELDALDILITGELFADFDNNTAAAAALYAFKLLPGMGAIPANYNDFSTGNGTVSFNIQLNLLKYPEYLAQVAEDKNQYLERRDVFLNHLFSRFAEQFSDFAMLSYHFMGKHDLRSLAVQHKENFLTNYPSLSNNRGKAYDYRAADADNISGFEKRFKTYTGIESGCCTSLCQFEVVKYEDTYSIQLTLAGIPLFNTNDTWEGRDNAREALTSIFSAVANSENHHLHFIQHEQKHQLQVIFNKNKIALYQELFDDEKEAIAVSGKLQKIFSALIREEDIIVSTSEYRLVLSDSRGKPIRVSVAASDNKVAAFVASLTSLRSPGDAAVWQVIEPENKPSGKFCSNDKKKPEKLIDIDAFKIDTDDTIVDKPGKFTYELLDRNHTFKFKSLNEFNSEKLARADAYQLLMLMAERENYQVKQDKRKKIFILNQGQAVAECLNVIDSSRLVGFIDKVHSIINNHYYRLSADPFPRSWKFTYSLGFKKDADLQFESVSEFNTFENAKNAATAFSNALVDVSLEVINSKYSLSRSDQQGPVLTCTHVGSAIDALSEQEKLSKAKQLLELNKQVSNHLHAGAQQAFDEGVQIDELSNTGAFVYRLVDKDNLYAKHAVEGDINHSTEGLNELHAQAQKGYQILNICLGGDITETAKDTKTGMVGYRYIVRCRGDFNPFKDGDILFKSIKVYSESEQAEIAFYENYLHIMSKAMDAANYGPNKYISLESPESFKPNTQLNNTAVVFVPKEIQELLTGLNTDITKILVATAKSYPVKILQRCGDDHKKYYPETTIDCLEKTGDRMDESNESGAKSDKFLYYFSVYNPVSSSDEWRSVNLYRNPQEALQAFYYFLMLLQYKGNYFAHPDDDNKTVVFVREVLAESKSRFATENEAWGRHGIEKFICIAQTADSFHSALRTKEAEYTFEVACNTVNGIHPCKYESPAKRDKALEKLFTLFKDFDTSKLFRIIDEGGAKILYGLDGIKLAELPDNDNPTIESTTCKRIKEILDNAGNQKNYDFVDGKSVLKKGEAILATASDPAIQQAEWRRQLLLLAYYFPVQKINGKFWVEIKLPGFNSPDNNQVKGVPGCGAPQVITEDSCYVAWQSACSYVDCGTAFVKWQELCAVLSNYENYRPYFDCTCYSYRIGLQTASDIVAYSPQHFTSPEMLCDAVKRSKKLINCEGLGMIEHILLRPRVKGDCVCNYAGSGNFAAQTHCTELAWTEDRVSKGSTTSHKIGFTPGDDPFSFIATVVLPAWPERFRKKENRDLLEMILYREAPAHVLLRILWLTPQDACLFEALHKKWKNAMLQKSPDIIEVTACNLMGFIVDSPLVTMSECTDCTPCPDPAVSLECLSDTNPNSKLATSKERLRFINQLFAVKGIKKTMSGDNQEDPVAINDPIAAAATNPMAVSATDAIAVATTDPITASTDPIVVEPDNTLTREEAKFINVRLRTYNENILRIAKDLGDNQLVKGAVSVLNGSDAKPLGAKKSLLTQKDPAKEINKLIIAILETEKAGSDAQSLTGEQKEAIINNLVWYYLDKIIFEHKNIETITSIGAGLKKIKERKFDMGMLFSGWHHADIEKYKSPDVINAVKEVLFKDSV
jgi:hypothetical protein